MSLTRKEGSTDGYDYRSRFPSKITTMEPKGIIFVGTVEKTKTIMRGGSSIEIKTGKMVPGLRVQMRSQLDLTKKSEPLSEVCEKAAQEVHEYLRGRGYSMVFPDEIKIITGRR